MGLLGKAFDNANSILESTNTFLDREVQLRSLKAADKTNELLAIKMMQENAERAAVDRQKAKEDTYRQRIKNNPELMRAVKAKQMEILEKTGNAVSVDAIIDVLYGKEDELTAEEEEELAIIQAECDAESLADAAQYKYEEQGESTSDEMKVVRNIGIMVAVGILVTLAFIAIVGL